MSTFTENFCTSRPHTALLMCLEKYSAIGISAIGNYGALYNKTQTYTRKSAIRG